MAKLQLSAAAAMAATCEPGKRKTDYWDTIIRGFVLEVRDTGSKTWALRYTDDAGRQRQQKIGLYGDITFDQARKSAQRLRSEVVLGGNPAAQKEVKKSIPFYADLAAQHLTHAKSYQRRPANTEAVLRLHCSASITMSGWASIRMSACG